MNASSRSTTIGVIGNFGLDLLLHEVREVAVDTPFGPTAAPVMIGTAGGRTIAFVPRTPPGLGRAPYRSPFKANLWALAHLGVSTLITVSSAGGLRETFPPGAIVVPDQYIDLTSNAAGTFYDDDRVVRVSLPDPFDPTLRSIAVEVLLEQGVRLRDFGTVVAVRMPRFGTRAESRFMAALGGDVLSMSVAPETGLAVELGLGVVNLSFITGFDAAVSGPTEDVATAESVERRLAAGAPLLRRAIVGIVGRIPEGFVPVRHAPADAIADVLARSAPALGAG